MAVIGALQHKPIPAQAVAIELQPNQQDQRVADATKGVFQRVKETATRVWNATVIGFQVAGDKISFVAFRVLEWIHPTLGPRIENAWLRVTNIWQAVRDAWKQEEVRKEMDHLRLQNHELQVKTRDYDQIVERNGVLIQERDRMQIDSQGLIQAKNFAEESLRLAYQQEHNIVGREEAVVQYRNVVVLKNKELEAANHQLKRERDEAKQALDKFLAGNQDLQQQLIQAQQQIADLSVLLPQNLEMRAQLALVVQSIHEVPRFGQKTELDLRLEGLLPKLQGQLDLAFQRLEAAKQALPIGGQAAAAVSSLQRVLTGINGFINEVPQAFARHANWEEPVNRILLFQQRQVKGVV